MAFLSAGFFSVMSFPVANSAEPAAGVCRLWMKNGGVALNTVLTAVISLFSVY